MGHLRWKILGFTEYIRMSSRRTVKNLDVDKSAIAEHVVNTNHTIDFDNTKMLARGCHLYDLDIRESIEINKSNNLMNREKGYYLSPSWNPIINKIKGKQLQTDYSTLVFNFRRTTSLIVKPRVSLSNHIGLSLIIHIPILLSLCV